MYLRTLPRVAPVTTTLAVLNILLYLITAAQSLSLMHNLSNSALAEAWVLYGPDFSLQRALGSMFLHVGPSHLAMNLFMLVILGRELEQALGRFTYLLTYLLGGIGAAIAVMLMDPYTPTAGASGALYALMAVLVGVAVKRQLDLRAPLVLVLVNLGFTFIWDGISLWGHLGGLLAGAILALPVVFWNKPFARSV